MQEKNVSNYVINIHRKEAMYTATHYRCIIQTYLTFVVLLKPHVQHSGCDPISKCAVVHTILPNSLPNLLQRCLHDLKKKKNSKRSVL